MSASATSGRGRAPGGFGGWLVAAPPVAPGELQLVEELGPRGRRRALLGTASAALLLLGAAVWVVRRFQVRGQFAPELWRPFRTWAIWRFLLVGLRNTLLAAGTALLLALVVGVLLAVGRASVRRGASLASGVFVEGFRACALVLLIRFLFFQLPRWFPGWRIGTYAFVSTVGGLFLYYSTVFAEVVRSGLRSLPRGQSEAGLSIGLTHGATMRIVLLPQALRRALPNLVTQSASLLKDASLGFLVTYDELLNRADIVGGFAGNKLQCYVVAGAMYVAVIAFVSSGAQRLRRDPRRSL